MNAWKIDALKDHYTNEFIPSLALNSKKISLYYLH